MQCQVLPVLTLLGIPVLQKHHTKVTTY